MLGFLIGAVCLVALVKVVRRGRYGYGRGPWGWRGGACSRGRFGGYDRHGGWSGGGPRGALRFLFERLDTSPGQEKVIMSALEELWGRKRALADEFVQTRKDVARAMRGERFDEVALSEAFGRQDALLSQLRDAASAAMKSVHEALDDRQRKIVGDLLENGPFGFRGGFDHDHHDHHHGGPYRQHWM